MSEKDRVLAYVLQCQAEAQRRYNELFDATIYEDACLDRFGTAQLSKARRDLLIDDALAILGAPYHCLSRQRWNDGAWRFLLEFTREEGRAR